MPPFQALRLASSESARKFLAGLDLADTALLRNPARSGVGEAGLTPSIFTPVLNSGADGLGVKQSVEQAYLVGSQIVSFNAEITAARRAAAINSCLLAQLAATKLHGTPTTPSEMLEWHAAYVNTLMNVGWVLQSGTNTSQQIAARGGQIDTVLLEVVGAVLGNGAAAALAVKVINTIAQAKKGDPFITLYNARTVVQNAVSFSAAMGSAAQNGFVLSVVECITEVQSELEQVLCFKWQSDSAAVDVRQYDLAVVDEVYEKIQLLIEQKVSPHVQAFIASLDV